MAEWNNISAVRFRFCSKYLIHKTCPRKGACPYRHANDEDIILYRSPSEDLDFVLGHYKLGSRHSVVLPQSEFAPRRPCFYYARGGCLHGPRCRFVHQQPVDRSERINHRNNNRNSGADLPSTSTQDIETPCMKWKEGFLQPKPKNEEPQAARTPAPASAAHWTLNTEQWVNAPEFVPKDRQVLKTYAAVVTTNNIPEEVFTKKRLCPYAERDGICNIPDGKCLFLHGNICDLCGAAALHPYSEEQRKKHIQECIKQHERDMELSFAVARSKGKTCGICFEVITEKSTGEQRFGILPNCNHCFCLTCIRKWRQAKQFENKIIRACPECRVTSDFVCPSLYWVETKEDKEKLIDNYKNVLAKKDCKYFKKGRGKCPFGNKCFYLHAFPDGTKTDVGPPPRRQRRQNFDGEIDVLQQIILWDFLDERENRWLYSLADDLDDLVAFFSDSDESEWSDYEFYID